MRTRDEMPSPGRTRRDFCVHTCQTLSLAALAAVLPGCGGGGNPAAPSNVPQLPATGGTIVNNTIALNVDPGAVLASVGGAALLQASGRVFLVARTGAESFSALTAICTHEACTITGFQNQTFVCPCHGSRYTLTGAVLNGPAPSSLRQFATGFANNVLTISV